MTSTTATNAALAAAPKSGRTSSSYPGYDGGPGRAPGSSLRGTAAHSPLSLFPAASHGGVTNRILSTHAYPGGLEMDSYDTTKTDRARRRRQRQAGSRSAAAAFRIPALLATAMALLGFGMTLSGGCSGGDGGTTEACATNAQCTPSGPCMVATCDLASGTCQEAVATDGSPCQSGAACVDGETCSAGVCGSGSAAAAACEGRECGTDGCGNSCGDCLVTEVCDAAGQCVPDAPMACGDVPAVGCCAPTGAVRWCDTDAQLAALDCRGTPSCGWDWAAQRYDCGTEGAASPSASIPWTCPGTACSDSCSGRECGFACGLSCGSCAADEYCSAQGSCTACSCSGRTCGTDQCGNPCGSCSVNEVCIDGSCELDACTPGGPGTVGCCDGLVLVFCHADQTARQSCSASCGWNPDANTLGLYDCEATGPEPTGTLPSDCASYPIAP